ncbi:sarcosine oxidase subunit gamma [Pacificibacter maritimus]|uniref:Sarcosine oxidase subunit gamma n=1 Tax=Pacificibacter maritimus TaxID=762213 RepID=A0A3N4UCA2_9RHOB|nr:sarcosine oxidase subunit gamma [Pacificibacter maritimus]RPE64801.1 sarcosine oxidase subunit gamma [Pacificibacter maritimus]
MTHTIATSPAGLLFGTQGVQISRMPPKARLSLRSRNANLMALSKAIGIPVPTKIGACDTKGGTEILCLGPDEWLVLSDVSDHIAEACEKLYASVPHSLVDISHREVTFNISGPQATELLTLGWPRDPASLRVGEGRRTVFDSATVVLWRDAENAYRMDVWNSFADHLFQFLQHGCRELAAQAY